MHYHQKFTQALTNDQLARKAPAVFAEAPHDSRSRKYAFVPTLPVVETLRRVGYEPYDASAANVRDVSRNGFQKHLVRFRHRSNVEGARGGVAELILISAHDGSSSYRMLAGWFEFLCTNGLMIGEKSAELRVRHKGTQAEVLEAVKDGAGNMLEYLNRISGQREAFRQVLLSDQEQEAFAKAALATRYDPAKTPLEPTQILLPRRREEMRSTERGFARARNDLWSTFNVAQENLIRGGQYARDANNRRRKQREIKGIDQNVGVNRALWTLTEEMAKLKNAA